MASFGIFSYTRGTPERDIPSRIVLGTSFNKPTKKTHMKETFRRPPSPFCPFSGTLTKPSTVLRSIVCNWSRGHFGHNFYYFCNIFPNTVN